MGKGKANGNPDPVGTVGQKHDPWLLRLRQQFQPARGGDRENGAGSGFRAAIAGAGAPGDDDGALLRTVEAGAAGAAAADARAGGGVWVVALADRYMSAKEDTIEAAMPTPSRSVVTTTKFLSGDGAAAGVGTRGPDPAAKAAATAAALARNLCSSA